MTGSLYLCSTPIGNLEDITLRALRVLKEVDLIAAEDTRHTRKLLSHYQIGTSLTSYHEHNARQKGEHLLKLLQEGKNIAIVSDAGTPGISDPGSLLVGEALAAGVPITPIPGATALITALCVSGLSTERFAFEGFLPRKDKEKKLLLESLQHEERTLVFYEAPHRLLQTLKSCAQIFPDRRLVAARELTKQYEEILRGTPKELLSHFQGVAPRGEFTLLLEGCKERPKENTSLVIKDPKELVRDLEEEGWEWREAIREAARLLGVSKREVYQAVKVDKEGR